MALITKDLSNMEKKMELDFTNGQMTLFIKENGLKTESTDMYINFNEYRE